MSGKLKLWRGEEEKKKQAKLQAHSLETQNLFDNLNILLQN